MYRGFSIKQTTMFPIKLNQTISSLRILAEHTPPILFPLFNRVS